MNEYLVSSHLGGLYISSADPESIEAYCEQCGDRDTIEASWDIDDKEAKIEAISGYFSRESLKSEEDLKTRISYFDETEMEKVDVIGCIIDDIISNNEENVDTINYLVGLREISTDEYVELIKRNREDIKSELTIVKDNMRKYIDSKKGIKKINKILSLYNN